jgi:hypothetical protein
VRYKEFSLLERHTCVIVPRFSSQREKNAKFVAASLLRSSSIFVASSLRHINVFQRFLLTQLEPISFSLSDS